jgi:ditrans,polycis-polyprenyl diphosphate synthase
MSSTLHVSQVRKWLLHSPPVEWAMNNIRELLIGALKQGPIPEHIAFVMDGNRRFARTNKIETVEGHNLGFEALARVRITIQNIEPCAYKILDPGSML